AAEREQAERRLEMGLALRKVMTYEQWQAAQELRREGREDREDRDERRPGGPRGDNHHDYEEGEME
ncbi:MAG TPA: hypothetical protein PKY30_03155, partial [Myxococcota bacterium]|nr:hypothetical protein [Myxococcota bacterium]